jgi:hypothetical protein
MTGWGRGGGRQREREREREEGGGENSPCGFVAGSFQCTQYTSVHLHRSVRTDKIPLFSPEFSSLITSIQSVPDHEFFTLRLVFHGSDTVLSPLSSIYHYWEPY